MKQPLFICLSGLGILLASTLGACSASPTSTPFGDSGGASAGAGDQGSGAGASPSNGAGNSLGINGSTGNGSTGSGTGGSSACAAAPYEAKQLPLDMYVMLDQSGSMADATAGGPTKWQAVTSAIQGFVMQPNLGGVSIGIQYFGLPPGGGGGGQLQCSNSLFCTKDSDCGPAACGPCEDFVCIGGAGSGDDSDSCNAADYATPEVEIASLPGVASAIVTSLGKHSPSTDTPTSAALQGAVDHAKAWATQNPEHVVIAVLATDGEPTECDTTIGDIAATAAAGVAGTPSVKTFTIGVFEPADIPSGPNALNAISAAGATGQAFVIDTTNPNMNVEAQFLAALNVIRGSALGCQYSIPMPDAGTPDYTKLNVQYTAGGSKSVETLLQYPDKAHCPASGDGWYYDNDGAPTQILLCDSTCSKVSADASGAIEVLIGCETMVGPVK